jgi:hypothetical protein
MKKISFVLLICILSFSFSGFTVEPNVSIQEVPNIKVEIDGNVITYNSPLISVSGRTLLPLRELLVSLGVPNDDAHILWNNEQRSVTINKDSTKVFLKIDDSTAKLNDAEVTLDAKPILYKGKSYIPIRFVAQCLGKAVDYVSATSTITIKSSTPEPITSPATNAVTQPSTNTTNEPTPSIDKWITIGNMPFTNESDSIVFSNEGRSGSTMKWQEYSDCTGRAVTCGNKVYVINNVGKVAEYDPLSNTWTERKAISQLKESKGFFKLVSANGKVYIVGNNFSEILEYNPATSETILITKLPTERMVGGAAIIKNKIYVLGGIDKNMVNTVAAVEEYDLTTNTWSKKSSMSTPVNRVTVTASNDKLYTLAFSSASGMSIMEYDPAKDTWTDKAKLEYMYMSPNLEFVNGKVYIIGEGRNFKANTKIYKVQVFDPQTNEITSKAADMPNSRRGISSTAFGGKIYLFGGYQQGTSISSNTYLMNVDEYTP